MIADAQSNAAGEDGPAFGGVRPFPPQPPPPSGSDVDFSVGDPEKFPTNALPTTIAALSQNLAEVYQVPVCMPAMSTLAVASGAVGSSIVVQGAFKDRETPLNLYVVPVALRGGGKGNSAQPIVRPLIAMSDQLRVEHDKRVAACLAELGLLNKEVTKDERGFQNEGQMRAALVAGLTRKRERIAVLEREVKRQRTLVVGDVTGEKLGAMLADNEEQVFSFSAEAGGLVDMALGKYSDTGDIELLLQAFTGDQSSTYRIGRNAVHLKAPCLALLWYIQPSVAAKLLESEVCMERGLTSRMLMFDTGARPELDDCGTAKFIFGDYWAAWIRSVVERRLHNQRGVIICLQEARDVFTEFHNETVLLGRRLADVEGELSRCRENSIKVAGLFAMMANVTTISAALAINAVAVVRWCTYSHLGLLQAGRRDRQRKLLERVLDLLGAQGRASVGDLARSHGIKRDALDALVALFPETLRIKKVQNPAGGRPAEYVCAVQGDPAG